MRHNATINVSKYTKCQLFYNRRGNRIDVVYSKKTSTDNDFIPYASYNVYLCDTRLEILLHRYSDEAIFSNIDGLISYHKLKRDEGYCSNCESTPGTNLKIIRVK